MAIVNDYAVRGARNLSAAGRPFATCDGGFAWLLAWRLWVVLTASRSEYILKRE